jgi:hypothetical protein
VVDSKESLKVSPTDKMVYYLEQHSTILSQISQQLSSIAPQVSIPSTPPPPYPPFNPSASDIRINAFWFMALGFSLTAALLAILVQQWVRDYMHIFQRYSDPLKSARIRQYLHEGSERWCMPTAAEAVPGLLHASLFLFFLGLADDTLKINTTIGLSTAIPIGFCGLLYIFTTFAPVIYPQSPYQNSFSALIWYMNQKLRGRIFEDWDGKSKSVSINLAKGQMELSMEETYERKARDVRAIRWLLDNITEDAEIESFAMSIPGFFSGEWSFEVWTEFSKLKEDNMPLVAQPPSRPKMMRNVLALIPHQSRTLATIRSRAPSHANAMIYRQASDSNNISRPMVTTCTHETNTIRELCRRIAHLFDTCKNRGVFASDELWRKRTRACVGATASLVCHANVELDRFGDIMRMLGDIGSFERIRDLSLAGRDESFVVRWTCLSIMGVREILNDNVLIEEQARLAVASFGGVAHSDRIDEAAEKMAWGIDKALEDSWECSPGNGVYDRIQSAVHNWVGTPRINDFQRSTGFTAVIPEGIDEVSQRIIHQLPGVQFDFPDPGTADLDPFPRQTFELFGDPLKLRFITCRQLLGKFHDCSRVMTIDGPSLTFDQRQVLRKVFWPKNLLRRQLWRLQDLRDGGGLGFAVELFLCSVKQLLSAYPSHESYSQLYAITLKAITSDWRKYKHSLGTQKILLDAIASHQGFLHGFDYPEYIADELWELLGEMLEGQTGPHISSAVQQLTYDQMKGYRYGPKAEAVISRLRASCSQAGEPSNPTA